MRDAIRWLKDALSTKELVAGMTYYRIKGGWIKATNGRLTAAHPCDDVGDFLVPGVEFDKITTRFGETVEISMDTVQNTVLLKSGRTRAVIRVLENTLWQYPEVAVEEWKPIPKGLVEALIKLRPFVSENATHPWAMGVILHDEWAYATNNVAVAGVQVPQVGEIGVIIPIWAVDFIINRAEGASEWHWAPDHLAVRWTNGAWLRSALIDAPMPMQVVNLVKGCLMEVPDVLISADFKEAYATIASLTEGVVVLTKSDISTQYKQSMITEEFETPELEDKVTIWSAKYLAPVIACAEWWSPQRGPSAVPFIGDGIMGYVVGRTSV